MAVDAGGLTVGERLRRIEDELREVLRRLEVYATEGDLRELKGRLEELTTKGSQQAQTALRLAEKNDNRLDTIERSYVGKGWIVALVGFIVVQFLAIIGLGLGFVYQLVSRH